MRFSPWNFDKIVTKIKQLKLSIIKSHHIAEPDVQILTLEAFLDHCGKEQKNQGRELLLVCVLLLCPKYVKLNKIMWQDSALLLNVGSEWSRQASCYMIRCLGEVFVLITDGYWYVTLPETMQWGFFILVGVLLSKDPSKSPWNGWS